MSYAVFSFMIVVDVETTGNNDEKNSIVSVGAVDFCNPTKQFYQECRIWEGAEIEVFALKKNGFTEEQIKDSNKMSLNILISNFLEWSETFSDKTLAGENPTFDSGFLENSFKRYEIKWPFGYRTVDLHALSYSHHISRKLTPPMREYRTDLSLNKTLVYVGLFDEPNPHNALTGAKMEAEAFHRLIYGTKLLEEFEKYEIPEYLRRSNAK